MNTQPLNTQQLFTPINNKQDEFIRSIEKFLLYSGAVGAGKSLVGCAKGIMLNMKYPGNRGLICRKHASSLWGSTLQTLLRLLPKDWIVSFNQQKMELVHKTSAPGIHSTIVFSGLDKGAADQYPTKIGSTEYGWIFFDECTEGDEGDWQMLGTRLRFKIPGYTEEQNKQIPRQLFGATNPDSANHHLYKFFFESDKKDRKVVLTTPYENPTLPHDYIESLEASLTGVNRERLLFGKWVAAEGLIYPEFNRETHISDDFLPWSDYKAIIAGSDSNYPLPRACILVGIRGDGKADILDEFYKERATIESLIDWLENKANEFDRTITVYQDPSDPQSVEKIDRGNRLIGEKAYNKVSPGISAVAKHFINDTIQISPSCVNLVKEILTYRWKPGKEGEPVKENDHAMDAFRYAIASHFLNQGEFFILPDSSGIL